MGSEFTAEKALRGAFRYRHRGDSYSAVPILVTDFDIKNLRVFEVRPPAPSDGDVGEVEVPQGIVARYAFEQGRRPVRPFTLVHAVSVAYADLWEKREAWTVVERPMTDDEFREINALCAQYDAKRDRPVPILEGGTGSWLEPIGHPISGLISHGEQVHAQAYIKRPKGDKTRWTLSLDIDDIKERHGEVLSDA